MKKRIDKEGSQRLTKQKGISPRGNFNKCVEFHGHRCPGLAIGFQAARILLKRLNVRKSPDEELLAIVETDACGADAVQVMTGCTFGKGNFVFKDYGKHAFSLVDRKKGKALRASLRSDAFEAAPKYLALSEKVQKDRASTEELSRFRQLQQERTRKILNSDPDLLFKIETISPAIPPKARVMKSEMCDFCGEPTKIDMLQKRNDQKLCIPCSNRRRRAQR